MNGYPPLPQDIRFSAIAPELVLSVTAMAVLLIGLSMRRGTYTPLVVLSLVGIAVSAGTVVFFWNKPLTAFAGTVLSDQFAQMVRLILLGIAAIAVLMAEPYLQERRIRFPSISRWCCFPQRAGW